MKILFNEFQFYNNDNKQQVAFGKRADVIYKSMRLCDEFAKEKLKNPHFTFERIDKLIKKKFPFLTVKYWNRRINGLDGRFEPCNFTICLFKRNLKKPENVNQFLITVIHELTHAYQDLDGEMSRMSIINKYADMKGDKTWNLLNAFIENEVTKITDKIFDKADKLTYPTRKSSQNNTLPKAKKDIANYISNFIKRIKSNPKYDKYDIKAIIENLYYIFISEFDAYKISNEFLSKINHKTDRFDRTVISLIKTVYTTFEKNLK